MPTGPSESFSIPNIVHGRLSRLLRTGFRRLAGALTRPAPPIDWDGSPAPGENAWQKYWGDTYSPELKRWLLKPVFEDLDRNGRIGKLIVDVGSGAIPVTLYLPFSADRKLIYLDIAAEEMQTVHELRIRLDIEKVAEPRAPGMLKAKARISRFLGIDPRGETQALADTIVFSEILNYVDFSKVLAGFSSYLKPGGRMIVCNLPIRGNAVLFSGNGLKKNDDLCRFFEGHQFEIEHKSFPCMPKDAVDDSEELILLVARKL